ncbi:MAG: DUF3857 domain-containing protein [Chitinophagales bacterium]
MNFFPKLLIFFLSLICSMPLLAQPTPMKFGDIKMSDLKMEKFEADPDAAAIILGDFGEVDFELGRGYTEYTRHRRIKILNKAGFDWADISIGYAARGGKIINIKGMTYVLDGGKMVEHKLDKKTIIDEEVNKNYNQKKISMPAVKEGCIIEYIYTVISENYIVPDWYFQTSEPILHYTEL